MFLPIIPQILLDKGNETKSGLVLCRINVFHLFFSYVGIGTYLSNLRDARRAFDVSRSLETFLSTHSISLLIPIYYSQGKLIP